MSIERYNELDERLEAAFTAFRRQHERMYPMPERPTQTVRRDRLMRLVLLSGLVGAVVVSASHTVVIFGLHKHLLIGVAAFLMLDAMIIAFGYYITREKYRNRQADDLHVMRYMGRGIFVAFVVTILANIQDVFTSAGFGVKTFGILWTVTLFVIELGKALSAPTMALITGHVYAMLNVQDAAQDRRDELTYQEQVTAWNDEFMRSWQANKARWGASVYVTVDKPVDTPPALPLSNAVSTQTDRQTDSRQTGAGYNRVSTAVETAKAWYLANPDQWNIPVRDLVPVIGVGKDSIAKARKELQQEQ